MQLRTLWDCSFQWLSEDDVCPEVLPTLLKNIIENFTHSFFFGSRPSHNLVALNDLGWCSGRENA